MANTEQITERTLMSLVYMASNGGMSDDSHVSRTRRSSMSSVQDS